MNALGVKAAISPPSYHHYSSCYCFKITLAPNFRSRLLYFLLFQELNTSLGFITIVIFSISLNNKTKTNQQKQIFLGFFITFSFFFSVLKPQNFLYISTPHIKCIYTKMQSPLCTASVCQHPSLFLPLTILLILRISNAHSPGGSWSRY
jgi:hypothetical protein